jgi:hypothetical protein
VRPARNSSIASRQNCSGYAGRVFGTDTILSRHSGASGQMI